MKGLDNDAQEFLAVFLLVCFETISEYFQCFFQILNKIDEGILKVFKRKQTAVRTTSFIFDLTGFVN